MRLAGVGKSELAKTLASYYFGSEEAMVRLDMSEFMERHTVSKLIGSPPGAQGFAVDESCDCSLKPAFNMPLVALPSSAMFNLAIAYTCQHLNCPTQGIFVMLPCPSSLTRRCMGF